MKIEQLIHKINHFTLDALLSWVKLANEEDILSKAEEFDIKNEDLYNQFELLLNSYKELMEALAGDNYQDAGDLIDTLNRRYERIMMNSYLNSEDFEEDFDPADFSEFIQKVVSDAENRLKSISDKIDVTIEEIKAAPYTNQFEEASNIPYQKSNTFENRERYLKQLEGKKRWMENLMFAKKVGRHHPDYPKYENLIKTRRIWFKNFLDNLKKTAPAKWREFQDKMNERVRKFYSKYKDTEKFQEKVKEKAIDQAKKIKEEKESGSLAGLLIHYRQSIANQKKEVKRAIYPELKKAVYTRLLQEEGTVFKPYIDQITEANKNGNAELVAKLTKELNNLMNERANSHPSVLAFNKISRQLSNYDYNLSKIIEYAEKGEVDPDALENWLSEGLRLADLIKGSKIFKPVANKLENINKYISNYIKELS